MGGRFIGDFSDAYHWGRRFWYKNGLWKRLKNGEMGWEDSNLHKFLAAPSAVGESVLFLNNSQTTVIEGLKRLNTDGRLQCAQCGKDLKALWIGNTNLSYCLECEG
jgi:hypothetical protein